MVKLNLERLIEMDKIIDWLNKLPTPVFWGLVVLAALIGWYIVDIIMWLF